MVMSLAEMGIGSVENKALPQDYALEWGPWWKRCGRRPAHPPEFGTGRDRAVFRQYLFSGRNCLPSSPMAKAHINAPAMALHVHFRYFV